MNVLLINPCWPYPYSKGEHTYNRIWPSLELANCASLLEQNGHKVDILDAHALRIKPDAIQNHIKKGYDKIFLTSSSLDKWICPNIDIDPFIQTVTSIKKITDEVYIMGYHGTADPQPIIEKTQAKAVILGEPEQTVVNICKNHPLATIANIAFVHEGSFVNHKYTEKLDLTTLPTPAYHKLDIKRYSYEILGTDFMLFETSRGCKYNCRFCSKIMTGNTIRYKNKEQIIQELETAISQHKVKNGYFIDLDFLSNKENVHFIADFLIEKKYDFHWCCQTRPNELDPELVHKMKLAGCKLIHFGVESGHQKFLDLSQKNIQIEKIQKAVALCKSEGIQTLAFYVFGFNTETHEDREGTFAFAKRLNTNFVSFHKMHPYEKNEVFMSDLVNEKEIDLFIKRKFLQYYLRFEYLTKLDFITAIRCLKLFLGRLFTLK